MVINKLCTANKQLSVSAFFYYSTHSLPLLYVFLQEICNLVASSLEKQTRTWKLLAGTITK